MPYSIQEKYECIKMLDSAIAKCNGLRVVVVDLDRELKK